MPSVRNDVTSLLQEWQGGDPDAMDRLMPLVYSELRKLAHAHVSRENSNTINTTSLVHEAYINLVESLDASVQSRQHFYGIASRIMRRVLIWYARKRKTIKRGGDWNRVTFDDNLELMDSELEELISLDMAMTKLEIIDVRLCRVVEYRYFGGMTIDETAALLEVSKATVKRDWIVAKTWLKKELSLA